MTLCGLWSIVWQIDLDGVVLEIISQTRSLLKHITNRCCFFTWIQAACKWNRHARWRNDEGRARGISPLPLATQPMVVAIPIDDSSLDWSRWFDWRVRRQQGAGGTGVAAFEGGSRHCSWQDRFENRHWNIFLCSTIFSCFFLSFTGKNKFWFLWSLIDK